MASAKFDLQIERKGTVWIVSSNTLRGLGTVGHDLTNALMQVEGMICDLWSVMCDDVKDGKMPTEQMKAFAPIFENQK